MSTITALVGTDGITAANSMVKINTNFTNLNTDKMETSVLDTDTALAANSDAKVATQKAVKAYADTLLGSFTSSKSGVSTGPSSSSTQTITHTLGRTPIVIRLQGIGGFAAAGAARIFSVSHGTYNATGNRCVYMGSATTSHDPSTSTTYAIRLETADGAASATGVVQNVTSTSFDIVWTAGGSCAVCQFIWEAN